MGQSWKSHRVPLSHMHGSPGKKGEGEPGWGGTLLRRTLHRSAASHGQGIREVCGAWAVTLSVSTGTTCSLHHPAPICLEVCALWAPFCIHVPAAPAEQRSELLLVLALIFIEYHTLTSQTGLNKNKTGQGH